MAMTERAQFLEKFFRSPRTVGSVIPSSHFLVNAMMRSIQWDQVRSIAELGAGTGVFTRAIAQRSRPETRVLVFEHDSDMRARLQAKFPRFHHRDDALQLTTAAQSTGVTSLDCVVSGLPLALFASDMRALLMDQVVSILNPGGLFIQFQYSLQMLSELRRRFGRVHVGVVPLNLPPAFVYVCQK